MPTYLNTATHPIDLGTGAFAAPQEQVVMPANDTIAEHLDAGRVVEIKPAKSRARKTGTSTTEEES